MRVLLLDHLLEPGALVCKPVVDLLLGHVASLGEVAPLAGVGVGHHDVLREEVVKDAEALGREGGLGFAGEQVLALFLRRSIFAVHLVRAAW